MPVSIGSQTMRVALRLVIVLLLAWAWPAVAAASFDDSRAWFERLSEAERSATQADLILAGHYRYLVDGRFGRGTFDALAAFQKSRGEPQTGVLSESERRALRQLASETGGRLGIERVSDVEARVSMMIPARLLSIRSPTGTGTSYVSEDGEFSLETMHSPLTDHSFEELFEAMTSPDPERIVTYRSFGSGRFVISGQIGDYSFYTMFVRADAEAIGYSLAWGRTYEREGPIASVYMASNFAPLGSLPPAPEVRKAEGGAAAAPPSAFVLPPLQPDIVLLNAEIDDATPAALEEALAARPGARLVALNSPGGSVDAAIGMAWEIRKRGLSTFVPPDMGCYSACAYIFLAGANRHVAGELGVHQISSEVADLVMAQTTLGDVIDALQTFGVHPQVISHMLRTPPDDMYIFSGAELAELGILRGDPVEVAVTTASAEAIPIAGVAYVNFASHSSSAEAARSRDYVSGRWGSLFGETQAEFIRSDDVYRIRLPAPSLERANAICAAVKADGGGCYVTGS